MKHGDLYKFNFDTFERFSALADALERMPLSASDWILDVGGRPGLLARHVSQRKIVTADLPSVSHKPYVRASGAALPFRDGTFGAVLTSDTLEHVPPQFREDFLRELWRVSRNYIIISGPFDTHGVRKAEDAVRELERESPTQATEWLSEHAQFGLPDLNGTWELYSRLGARGIIVPGGAVVRWFMLFAAQSFLEGIPLGSEPLSLFMPAYNRHFMTSSCTEPAYRHMLIFAKQDTVPPMENALSSVSELPRPESTVHQLAALQKLFTGIAGTVRPHGSSSEARGLSIDQAYIEQLEKALKQQEGRLQDLERRLAETHGQRGLRQRLKRLFG